MCLGRLTSTFLSTLILPSKLVIISMAGCILSTILLMFLAPLYYISLYIGVFVSGFFLSWQFASAFSWTSYHMNITGKLSSIFFIGNNNFILFYILNIMCVVLRPGSWQPVLPTFGRMDVHAESHVCDLHRGGHGGLSGSGCGGHVGCG